MASLEFRGVSKSFRETPALRGLDLSIRSDEFFVLLGPTGAGKTTLLRCAAGLESLDEGEIRVGGNDISGLSPSARDMAFISQQYSLYPRYTVFDNMAFPLRAPSRRLPESEIRKRVTSAAELLSIAHLLDRRSDHLAGGEMQRVAIGRAIVRSPKAYLMDEPVSSLDAKLREKLRVELKALQRTAGITTLYVTHDQVEAMSLGDSVGVMRNGKLEQLGSPRDIYDRPANTFVAAFVGTPAINLLPVDVEDGALVGPGGAFRLQLNGDGAAIGDRRLLFLGLRPEDMALSRQEDASLPSGRIALVESLGMEDSVLVEMGGGVEMRALCSALHRFQPGENVRVGVDSKRWKLFDARTGKSLG